MFDDRLKIGCCGFPLPKEEYAARFQVVEVQQTFYQPPRVATLQRWRAAVPDQFEFTLKAWQLITHSSKSPTYRRLKARLAPAELEQCGSFQCTGPVLNAWETSRLCAGALRAKCVLFQCPASFLPDEKNVAQMRQFFSSVQRDKLVFLWEPRGDWSPELIGTLCAELDLVHAVDPFVSRSVSAKFIYFRLHGGKGFKHIYSEAELQFLRGLIVPAIPAYVMFNNIQMLPDSTRFLDLMRRP